MSEQTIFKKKLTSAIIINYFIVLCTPSMFILKTIVFVLRWQHKYFHKRIFLMYHL